MDVQCFDLIKWFVLVLWCDTFVVIVSSDESMQNQGRGLVDRKLVNPPPPPAILLLAIPRRLFCVCSLMILDVVCRYLSLFVLYINKE